MKSLSDELKAAKASAYATVAQIIDINTGVYKYTNDDRAITIGTDTYEPFPFKIAGGGILEGGQLDTLRVSFGNLPAYPNVASVMASIVLNNTWRDKHFLYYEAWFDAVNVFIGKELMFWGKIEGRPSLNRETCEVLVSPHFNPNTKRFQATQINRSTFPFLPQKGVVLAGYTIFRIK
jgi:hypothetical protein